MKICFFKHENLKTFHWLELDTLVQNDFLYWPSLSISLDVLATITINKKNKLTPFDISFSETTRCTQSTSQKHTCLFLYKNPRTEKILRITLKIIFSELFQRERSFESFISNSLCHCFRTRLAIRRTSISINWSTNNPCQIFSSNCSGLIL